MIERKIHIFRRQDASLTPTEAALLHRLVRLMRAEEYEEVIEICDTLEAGDPSLANPRLRSLLGQALINAGPQNSERARECFRQAESMNFRDIPMMRSWYYMETRSGYGLEEAKRICRTLIAMPSATGRLKSEFVSKLAWCFFSEAQSLSSVSLEKAVPLYRTSIENYLEALWLAEQVPGMSVIENLGWIERPINSFLRMLRGDINPYVKMIEELPSFGHDVSLEGAKALIRGLVNAFIPSDDRTRRKTAGMFTRAVGRLDKTIKDPDDYPGFSYIIEVMEKFSERLLSTP
ncbi:MAG: hypothetical protein ABIP07_06530 [Sphingomicrobium sp.]